MDIALTLAKYLRSPKTDYLLFFAREDLTRIIQSLSKYTQRFFLLDDFKYIKDDFKTAVRIDVNNIGKSEVSINALIEDIFKKEKIYSDNIENCNNVFAIFFTVSSIEEDYANFYEFKLLEEKLPNNFFMKSLIFLNDQMIINYTNIREKKDFVIKDKPIGIFLSNGIGDFAILYNILVSFIQFFDREVYIILNLFYNKKPVDNIERLIGLFDLNVKIIKLEYPYFTYAYDYAVHSCYFDECYLIDIRDWKFQKNYVAKFQREYLHYSDYIMRMLSCSDRKFPAIAIEDLEMIFFTSLDEKEKEIINSLIDSEKPIIGLQFCTTNDEFYERGRYWAALEVDKYCNLVADKYKLINLTPFSRGIYRNSNFNFSDASSLSLIGMIYLISKINLVIGIDSCCGHLASMFNVPNVTLWTLDTPTDCRTQRISWRPQNMNYSIVPKTKKVDADTVFSCTEKIFKKEINLKESIKMIDTLKGENILYI